MEERKISAREAEKLYPVSAETLRVLAERKVIEAEKGEEDWYFTEEAIEEFLANR